MQQKRNTSLQHLFKPKNVLLTTLAVLLVPTLTYGQTQSGTLDTSFGTGGKVTTDFAGSGDGAGAIAARSAEMCRSVYFSSALGGGAWILAEQPRSI
jgi:hypothetical protein